MFEKAGEEGIGPLLGEGVRCGTGVGVRVPMRVRMRRHVRRRAAACQCGDQAERGQPLWLQDSGDLWSGDVGPEDM